MKPFFVINTSLRRASAAVGVFWEALATREPETLTMEQVFYAAVYTLGLKPNVQTAEEVPAWLARPEVFEALVGLLRNTFDVPQREAAKNLTEIIQDGKTIVFVESQRVNRPMVRTFEPGVDLLIPFNCLGPSVLPPSFFRSSISRLTASANMPRWKIGTRDGPMRQSRRGSTKG